MNFCIKIIFQLQSIHQTSGNLRYFFEKVCRNIADTQKDGEQIAECELNIIDKKNNEKYCILFDIVNYAGYEMEKLNIFFYNSVDKKYKRFFIDMINENSCISGYEFIYFIQM